MENKDISQMALQKIKEGGIKPIPKNFFNFKRVIFWSLVFFSIIVGIVSFAILLSILFTNDWYLYNKLGLGFIFKSLPYFWVLALILFTILGDFYYRRTSFGYRYKTTTIVGVYILITIFFGSILHIIGIGKGVEESFHRNIPIYHGFMFDRDEFWSHPEEGFISGQIILIDGNLIRIIDIKNNIWVIETNDAFIGRKVKIQEGEFVKIIGGFGDGIFIAEQIRPGIGNRFNQNKKMDNMMR